MRNFHVTATGSMALAERVESGDPRGVVLPFHTPLTERAPGEVVYLDDDDDEFIDDMLEKEAAEIFCDLLMWLLGFALVSFLLMVTAAFSWTAVKLGLATYALLPA
jgi:hypothetical protein